jgi:hypothetical protein
MFEEHIQGKALRRLARFSCSVVWSLTVNQLTTQSLTIDRVF